MSKAQTGTEQLTESSVECDTVARLCQCVDQGGGVLLGNHDGPVPAEEQKLKKVV